MHKASRHEAHQENSCPSQQFRCNSGKRFTRRFHQRGQTVEIDRLTCGLNSEHMHGHRSSLMRIMDNYRVIHCPPCNSKPSRGNPLPVTLILYGPTQVSKYFARKMLLLWVPQSKHFNVLNLYTLDAECHHHCSTRMGGKKSHVVAMTPPGIEPPACDRLFTSAAS